MSEIEITPWEPEETVGKLWHVFASRLDAPEVHEGASVDLSEIEGRLAVFFRGLGGLGSVALKGVAPDTQRHRISFRRSLGRAADRLARASFDGEALRLPERIAIFPAHDANLALYFWLTAAAAHAGEAITEDDPLRADIHALQDGVRLAAATLSDCRGLSAMHATLSHAVLAQRSDKRLPLWEQAVEHAIRHLLGAPVPDCPHARLLAAFAITPDADLSAIHAPKGYKPFEYVPLWPDLRPLAARARVTREAEKPDSSGPQEEMDQRLRRAKRKSADQAERKDSLILHKFEAILSWTEFLDINRRIEDDDDDNAKKAADDQDEISLTQISKKAATRLKLHLDMSPEDADRERLSGKHIYPEWDHRRHGYIADHVRVLASDAEPTLERPQWLGCAKTQRRIRAVKRQFEALRPRRVILPQQIDGDELDIEAAVRARVEFQATGRASDRVYRAARSQDRDLAVSILLDTSRSTESAVTGRQVIDIEREALIALAWGLDACGDAASIHAFSSLRRDRVFVTRCKGFSERMGSVVEARIAGLKPGFYTRLGAAIRHVSADLAPQTQARKLLLVITDGKPNDLDHYEGRHGIEDSRMAIIEARRAGQAVFGVTVDAKGQSWFGRMFGRGGFAVIPNPEKLTTALPDLYRHLVAG